MSRILSAALLVAACLPAPSRAAPPTRPNGPAPELLSVRIGPDGNLSAVRTQVVYRMEARVRLVDVGGKMVPTTETVTVPTYVSVSIRYAAGALKAFDLDGLPIDAGKLPKLLEKETTVILSTDGEPPDAFYRQFFKEGTLLLVLPTAPTVAPAAGVTLPPPPPKPE